MTNPYTHIRYFTQWERVAGRRVQRVMSVSGVHVADIIDWRGAEQFMDALCAQESGR